MSSSVLSRATHADELYDELQAVRAEFEDGLKAVREKRDADQRAAIEYFMLKMVAPSEPE